MFASEKDSDEAVRQIGKIFAAHKVASSSFEFRPSNTGALEWNAARPDVNVAPYAELTDSISRPDSIPA